MASNTIFVLLALVLYVVPVACAMGGDAAVNASSGVFNQEFMLTWAPSKVKILGAGHGQQLQLSLDTSSGSGFASKHSYLFGNINMQIKLVPGDSAGTVTAYYLASQLGARRDEIDFEFLGNVSGQPYALQTNVYTNGTGNREQRIYLWFDPTLDFHSYSVSWNKQRIMFLVDGAPIRVFSNNEALGLPYPNKQPMGVYSSLWNADDWATRGGLEKINWEHAPFIASYRGFKAEACVDDQTSSFSYISACTSSKYGSINEEGAATSNSFLLHQKLQWVQKNYMIYDYCTDKLRYPLTPTECLHVNF